MTELSTLIKGLTTSELKAIKNSFCTQKIKRPDGLLMERLFDCLSTPGNTLTDEELSGILYKTSKNPALTKLQSRLYQHVLEVLASDEVLYDENIIDPTDRRIIRLRKKMVQYRVLYRRKTRTDLSVTNLLLNEIIKEAKEIEQYDVLTEALLFKKYSIMFREGIDEVQKLQEQLELSNFSFIAVITANDYYFNLISNIELKQKHNQEQILQMLRTAIVELEGYIKKTNSATIKYFCNLMKLDELQRTNKHSNTIDICLDVINLLKKHSFLFRQERMGYIHDDISLCQVYRGEFDEAIKSAKKAQGFYSPESISYLISQQQEFYACFYGKKFKEALSLIEKMLTFPKINAGEFRHDKYLFLKACTLFKLGEYKKTLAICNEAMELTLDKGRWDTGIRFIKIMCFIELNMHDQAYDAIEALRKLNTRNKEKELFSSRDELIYKALHEYGHSGFEPVASTKLQNLLEQLSAKSGTNAWNYYTHEPVPVHEFIASKVRKRKKDLVDSIAA